MARTKHIRFDWAIKRLLRNKANYGILEGFLSVLLKEDITISEILESESNQEHENNKYNRVDILVKDSRSCFMLIEIQNEKEDDYFHRMLYGQAKLISERLNVGDAYGKLTRVYSINIVYFPLGIGEDYIYKSNGNFIGVNKKDVLQLSPKQQQLYKVKSAHEIFTQYYILKVNAFNDNAVDSLDEWIYFLKNSEIRDDFTARGLAEAREKLRVDDLLQDEKNAYDAYVKEERIRESEIRTAFTDGVYKTEQKYGTLLKEAEEKADKEKKEKELERREKEQIIINAVLSMHNAGIDKKRIAINLQLQEEKITKILADN